MACAAVKTVTTISLICNEFLTKGGDPVKENTAFNKIICSLNRFNARKCGTLEFAVLCFYIVALSAMMCFHEPWYDEAQAWLIARDGSWSEILFEIPHYEGHPPLWYVVLAVFAKVGADFDLTLKLLTLALNTVAVALLLFKLPFPRTVRLLLPFTYFLFYQHGVICRPYSILLIGFLLAAILWQQKNEKPFRFCLALMLMCASSAYGIIFAGGITLAWLWELKEGMSFSGYIRALLKGTRFYSLLTLLLFALVNIASILPQSDTFAASYGLSGSNPLPVRILYMFTGSLADATFFSAYDDYDELRYAVFNIPKLVIGCVLGACLLAFILYCGKKCKTNHAFLIPFALFALFSGIVYFYLQHIDVLLQFLLFWACISVKEREKAGESASESFFPAFKNAMWGIISVSVAVSLYWNIGACYNEVIYQYGFAQQLSDYLDQYGLSDYGVMVRWMQLTDDNGMVTYTNTNQTVNGVALNAYYDTNVVINMNGGVADMTYVTHRIPSEEENRAVLESWREMGLPEITFDKCQLKTLFPEYRDIYVQYYTSVLVLPEYHLWKGGYQYSEHRLYVRNDIARKHFLQPEE